MILLQRFLEIRSGLAYFSGFFLLSLLYVCDTLKIDCNFIFHTIGTVSLRQEEEMTSNNFEILPFSRKETTVEEVVKIQIYYDYCYNNFLFTFLFRWVCLSNFPEENNKKSFIFLIFILSFDFCFSRSFSHRNPVQFLADSHSNTSINRTNSNKNLLIAQMSSLSDPNKAPYVRHLSLRPSSSDPVNKDYIDLLPTAAESFFPWRRDKSYQSLGMGIWI